MEYKWVDITDCSFGDLHRMLEQFTREGWQLDSINGPEQLPETAFYGNSGALQLWLKRRVYKKPYAA